MDLVGGLERTLHGKVKPMITQCSMRHLYAASPAVPHLIEQAKQYERRRCNHHVLDQPLPTLECLTSVVDPKSSKTNKHRYVVASQDGAVRASMRGISGVPLVYINRSVMILEPMAEVTEVTRDREERGKLKTGLKSKRGSSNSLKRKRDNDDAERLISTGPDGSLTKLKSSPIDDSMTKKRSKGPKGPNPLSVKKPKKSIANVPLNASIASESTGQTVKKRRRRRQEGQERVEATSESKDAVTSLDA
ncbi:MAG: hypothetical protein M1825_002911 [Sarcosagium campestre]|nr:MAG: hypothetical protein M1825_002911 [Sarcosagium campestre]